MGKKTSRKTSSEAHKAVEEAKGEAVDLDLYESDLVKLKKENAKTLEKKISKMDSEIK